jgi:chromosomal replication initiation ATPase DnaA
MQRIAGTSRKPMVDVLAPEPAISYDPIQDRMKAAFVTSLVAMTTGIPARDIVAASRNHASAARARQMAMYLAHVGFAWPLARVGQAFGRDRTTASHACHRIEDMRDDARFDACLNGLEACLRAAPDGLTL